MSRPTASVGKIKRSLPNKSSQLTEKIYECLLREIITGALVPGQYLSEVHLTQRFQASRTPVRDALINLHREALLHKGPFKGYVVAELSLEFVRELFELRLLLEPAAAKLAARNSLADGMIQKIEKLQEKMQEAIVPASSYQQFLQISELDCDFHKAIGEASGNQRLATLIGEIMNQIRRFQCGCYRNRPWLSNTLEEHTTILDAIKSKDSPRAEHLMQQHIRQSISRTKELSLGALDTSDLQTTHGL